MKNIKLSKRLHKAAEYVIPGQIILDVGSDHAYLPIHLLQQGKVPAAIAGEVAKGPFENAREKVAHYQLENQISVRLGDGLNVVDEKDQLGTIFICGMGGLLIADILNEAIQKDKLSKETRLVLQPNNAEDSLRKWLVENHYRIINEAIVEENEKIYEMIIAEFTTEAIHYSKDEMFFGPKLIDEQSEIFLKKWNRVLGNNKTIQKQLQHSENKERLLEIEKQIQQIEKVIS